MDDAIAGFEWDDGNREKCRKHGVSIAEIEALFMRPLAVRPDAAHSRTEQRFLAVGKGKAGRGIFLIYTLRRRDGKTYIRPISARYMHKKEIEHHEKENPDL
jgi:uncharacterized protein